MTSNKIEAGATLGAAGHAVAGGAGEGNRAIRIRSLSDAGEFVVGLQSVQHKDGSAIAVARTTNKVGCSSLRT